MRQLAEPQSRYIVNSWPTPNAIVDDGVLALLDGDEVKCLVVCQRKILGWQNRIESRQDHISVSQLSELTGLSGATVIKKMAALERVNIVKTIRKGEGTRSTLWELNTGHLGPYDFDYLKERKRGKQERQVAKMQNVRTKRKSRARYIPEDDDAEAFNAIEGKAFNDIEDTVVNGIETQNTLLNTPKHTNSGDAEKNASPVVDKPSVLVDGKPMYTTSTPDTAAPFTTPGVTNGDGSDPEGLFAGARAEMPDYKASAATIKTNTRAAMVVFGQNSADVANSDWQEVREPNKRRILDKFSELFGIMPPKSKSMRGQWLYGVNELLAVTGGDAAEVLRLMGIFADKRRAGTNGYQFDLLGPKSLANKMHILYSQSIMGETRAGNTDIVRITEVGGTGGLVSGSTGQDVVHINSIGAVR